MNDWESSYLYVNLYRRGIPVDVNNGSVLAFKRIRDLIGVRQHKMTKPEQEIPLHQVSPGMLKQNIITIPKVQPKFMNESIPLVPSLLYRTMDI